MAVVGLGYLRAAGGTPSDALTQFAIKGVLATTINDSASFHDPGRATVLLLGLIFLGGVVVGFACAGLAARARVQGGVALGFGASLFLAVVVAVLWLGASWLLPHPDEVRWTDLVPGAVLVGAGLALIQVITANFLGPKLAHESSLYGSLGVSFVVLGWLYALGRLLVAAPLLNSAMVEHRERIGVRSGSASDQGGSARDAGSSLGADAPCSSARSRSASSRVRSSRFSC